LTDTSNTAGTTSTGQQIGPTVTGSAAPSSGALTLAEAENYWIQAGGNPQAAQMAAAVADASSGLNPNITRTNPDGSVSVGLWLLPSNGTPPGSTDPVANARAAIQLSNNGTDWSQWCVAWSDNNCGLDGGTYLGSGSNALGSLASQLSPGSYNVIGATPSGNGTGASSASSTVGSSSTSSTSKYLLIAGLIGVLGIVYYYLRKKRPTGEGSEPQGDVGN
jgi:Lysozyme like domain